MQLVIEHFDLSAKFADLRFQQTQAVDLKSHLKLQILEVDCRPAAAFLEGARPGEGLGSHLQVGDFNQDGLLDNDVAASEAKTVNVVRGPL